MYSTCSFLVARWLCFLCLGASSLLVNFFFLYLASDVTTSSEFPPFLHKWWACLWRVSLSPPGSADVYSLDTGRNFRNTSCSFHQLHLFCISAYPSFLFYEHWLFVEFNLLPGPPVWHSDSHSTFWCGYL